MVIDGLSNCSITGTCAGPRRFVLCGCRLPPARHCLSPLSLGSFAVHSME